MLEQLAPVGIGATSYSAYSLETVGLIVLGATAILSAIFWLIPPASAFATFWDQIENPIPPPPPQVKTSWITITIIIGVSAACLLIGLYILIILQDQLLPYFNYCASPQNMSQACQTLRQLQNSAMQ